ncbi:MAG: hypothetical protein ACFB12_15830 [Leptolyngbyaceae cyanobacterium]
MGLEIMNLPDTFAQLVCIQLVAYSFRGYVQLVEYVKQLVGPLICGLGAHGFDRVL